MHKTPKNRAQVHVPANSNYYFSAGNEDEQEVVATWYAQLSITVSFVWNTLPMKEVFRPIAIVEVNTLSMQHIQTPKNLGPCLCTRWRQLLFVRLSKGATKRKCILCLKYFTYEEVILLNHWSEYFEHSTHMNSKKILIGLPFVHVDQPKSIFVFETSHRNDVVHLNPLFEILNLWMSYFSNYRQSYHSEL